MTPFLSAFEQFVNTGDFLALTREFEQGIPQAQQFDVGHTSLALLDNGVLLATPKDTSKSNKDIVISSGIHGNETAPIEIVNQLVSEIVLGKTTVQNRTLFIIGNPVSMNISQRFEKENLNRLFCQKFKNIAPCYERERAEKLEQYVTDFFENGSESSERLHYDLHTAIRPSKYEKFAIYPYKEDKNWDLQQLEFLRQSGVSTILFGHAPSGTFSYYSSATFGAHAFTVELGKVLPFGQNDMTRFKAMTDNLRQLISGDEIALAAFDNNNFTLFEVLGDITKETDNFRLLIDDDVSNFTDFVVGTQLSQDEQTNYVTKRTGESIVFPNAKVANGQRAGLMVIPTTL